MHHILIVDDERVERKGIRFLLKQMGLPLLVDEAANGKEALEFLSHAEQRVDILFTDIKMPFMDGMELIKTLHNENKHYKTIIFSGYSEFEYAKFAVKMGVEDYILKPVDPAEFEKTIRKVIGELEEEKAKEAMQEEQITFMKDHLLYSMINGIPLQENEIASYVDPAVLDSYGCMLLFEFKNEAFSTLGNGCKEELTKAVGVPCEYLNLNLQQGLLLFPKKLPISYKGIGEAVCKFFKIKYSMECYVAVSTPWEDGRVSLAKKFEEVEERMEDKFYSEKQRVFLPQNEKTSDIDGTAEDDTYLMQMEQDIKRKDGVRLRVHFDALCNRYKEKGTASQIYIKFVFANLLKLIHENGQGTAKTRLKDEIDELYQAKDYKEVIAIAERTIKTLEREFVNPQAMHRQIESIKQYIYENYEKELSVEQLAEQVYLAPSYVSHIFKKETGENLSKFIKSYRMEKAKDMLEKTHKKIVTISYEVGYSNVSYFCQSFREYFGVSPQKFRNQGAVNETDI